MKRLIILLTGIILFSLTCFSFVKHMNNLWSILVILDALYMLYILFKIYRKYRGHVVIDSNKRKEKPKEIKKVSVVIPNYNYANYIEDRIDSILNQTYPIYELIILDDKSTDDSVKVIKDKIKKIKNNKDIKIKTIFNEKNSGNVFKQWQKAFEESTGDYLWIAEADDLCDKHFLNVAMQGFDNENVVLSYTESKEIDENGSVACNDFRYYTDTYNRKIWNKNFVMDGKKFLDKSLSINNSIVNVSSVVFKKIEAPIDEYLIESQKYKLSGDWCFYVRFLMNGDIAYSTDSLNFHRIHRKSVTTKTNNKLKYQEIYSIQNIVKSEVNVGIISNHYGRIYRNAVKKLK